MMQIFISYSSKDNAEAFKICEYLEQNGKKCFIAPRDIQPGREYGEELINGIDNSKAMLLLLSNNSNKSPHVLREVERAVSKSIPIYACKLEDVELSKSMEYFLMTHQWGSVEKKSDYTKLLKWAEDLSETEGQAVEKQEESKEQKPKAKKDKAAAFKLIGALAVILLCIILLFTLKQDKQEMAQVSLGDTITFGTYNGEAIEWRVLKVEDNLAVLVSKDILTMKAYDAAESGKFNYAGEKDYWGDSLEGEYELQVQTRGNSDWSVSNIRTWLNSDKEVISYSDQEPHVAAMSEHKNGYNNEAGFLHDFSQEELAAIVETEIITNTNELTEGETVTTQDKVFLLSVEELAWFDEAGISKLATPTEAAITQDQSEWYEVEKNAYDVDSYYWWLREPVEGTAYQCYMVSNGYWEAALLSGTVGLEGYGVRPALTIDLSSEYICELLGTEE